MNNRAILIGHVIVFALLSSAFAYLNGFVNAYHPWTALFVSGWCCILILHLRHVMPRKPEQDLRKP